MKLLIASDIHGCAHATRELMLCFHQDDFDYLVLLGDILNHGPRNPLPLGYDPQATAELLNQDADRIIAVRGNCDSEVDQMMLTFPMMADYNQLLINERRWFLSHGHQYGPDSLPPLRSHDVFVSGHVHVPEIIQGPHCYLLNPGSITMPRGGHPATYAVYDNERISIHRLDDDVVVNELKLA
ncbi:phosphodiesterase [Corallincola platygyrae]|uniref:Phosphoesterase n=1 Tax=Corallincola platygyrae TaxID=1193278 RepID=A0ABW4XIW4_9GAMM